MPDALQHDFSPRGGLACGRAARTSERESLGLVAVRWFVDGMNVIGTPPRRMVERSPRRRWCASCTCWRTGSPRPARTSSSCSSSRRDRRSPRPSSRSPTRLARAATRPTTRSSDASPIEREPGEIRVVTSDLWLVDRVRAAGATVQSADSFRAQLEERLMAPITRYAQQRRSEHRLPGRRRRPRRPAVPARLDLPGRAALGGARLSGASSSAWRLSAG